MHLKTKRPNYVRQKLIEQQEERDKFIIVVGQINALLSKRDQCNRQKSINIFSVEDFKIRKPELPNLNISHSTNFRWISESSHLSSNAWSYLSLFPQCPQFINIPINVSLKWVLCLSMESQPKITNTYS